MSINGDKEDIECKYYGAGLLVTVTSSVLLVIGCFVSRD